MFNRGKCFPFNLLLLIQIPESNKFEKRKHVLLIDKIMNEFKVLKNEDG